MIPYLQDHAVDASTPLACRFPEGSFSGPGLWDFRGDTVSLQPSLSMAFRMEEGLNRPSGSSTLLAFVLLTEVGRITQVLPAGCNVVQGEAFALALLLKHTTGDAAVTADCKPAILQAQGDFFKNAHANIWEEVWEERHHHLAPIASAGS
eukprot:s156_g1.t1